MTVCFKIQSLVELSSCMFLKTQTIPFRGTLMSARDVVEELVVYNSFVTSDVSRAIFFLV